MNTIKCFFLLIFLLFNLSKVNTQVVFTENNGIVAIEAENYSEQTNSEIRKWVIRTTESKGAVAEIAKTASNGAFIEVAPDTRITHGDKLIKGENFSNVAGEMTIVSYRINILTPGKYYVWVRAYSTGSEDNGVHVGLDGMWPESGQRMQWCEGKNVWTWASKQRTDKVHCGEEKLIFLDIPTKGEHTVSFSMREDGFKMDKIILSTNYQVPEGAGAEAKALTGTIPAVKPTEFVPVFPATKDGNGHVTIDGEQKQWHKVTLNMAGPFATEMDADPNPFTDYRMEVIFRHESGTPEYKVPGYFAADGNAGETGASEGNCWRAHLSPDKTGKWSYEVKFLKGAMVATTDVPWSLVLSPFNGVKGEFEVSASDKTGRDFRSKGRLEYVGKHYLQFKGNGEYFLKAGADAPETLLGYAGFDGTVAMKPNVPLKSYKLHEQDWKAGDPLWKGSQGKGLIGAINYLSGKGCNSISFLTYNAGGDGDNVWPFTERNAKFHYDCSKLDQWQLVFDYAQLKGMYLHFKTQETENDDNHQEKKVGRVPESLDGGELGPQRILYYRELIARYGYLLAINWNLGEENTQTTVQQQAMAAYLDKNCPYKHNIVLHTYPNQQDKVYAPLVGNSLLTGVSLQNGWNQVHKKTLQWINASAKTDRPWVVTNDEQGSASEGVPPDPGYKGWDAKTLRYDIHDVRKQTLWANLMAGGAGVEYYFGYKLPENDLVCEDFRSRDKSWDFCNIALTFFKSNNIPFWEMTNRNDLIGNTANDSTKFCLAKPGELFLVYLAYAPASEIDLSQFPGSYDVKWFNSEAGGAMVNGSVKRINGGKKVNLGNPPNRVGKDWLIVITKRK
jgi:hypothetical protein